MILGYFGHCAPLGEVRDACGVSRDGSSVYKIYKAAESYKLKVRARKLARSRIDQLSVPAILHWEMNHFVVYAGCSGGNYRIADPAVGLREITAAEFDAAYTGVALTFETTDNFVQRSPEPAAFRQTIKVARTVVNELPVIVLMLGLMTALGLVAPLLTRVVVDQVVADGQSDWLSLMVLGFLIIAGVYFLLSWSRSLVLVRIQERLAESITDPMLRHLLSLPLSFFKQHYTGDLLARVDSIHRLRNLLGDQAGAYLFDGLVFSSYLILMLMFNFQLSLIVIVAVILYVVSLVSIQRALQNRSISRIVESSKHSSQLVQMVKGVLPIKSSGGEPAALNRWLHQFIEELSATGSENEVKDRGEMALMVLPVVVPAVILMVGVQSVLSGSLSLGTLLGFQILLLGFLAAAGRLVQIIIDYGSLRGGLQRLDDVLMANPEPCGQSKAPLLLGKIDIEGMSFHYDSFGPPTIDNVSLNIPRGSKVALVGPSGSGKSTLVQLLLGLYQPHSGKILFDGLDLAQLDYSSVRRQIGVVLQEPDILTGTIHDNISLYHPEAPLEDVVNAARVAQIHNDVLQLPQGYQTTIHHDSGLLSGGQRQRLALARAILHRPAILILDEATSAVDAITENAIANYLETRPCTQIVVAHRLSTVRNADLIYVLNDGKIVEQGRHQVLVTSGGLYQHLFNSGRPESAVDGVLESPSITGGDLEAFSCLRHLSNTEKLDLAQQLEIRKLPAGMTLIEQGAPAAGLFLLAAGRLHANFDEPGLDTWKLAEIHPGAVVGEVSLVDGAPASATVATTESSVLYQLTVEQFVNLRRERNVLAGRLLAVAAAASAARIYDCYQQLEMNLFEQREVPVMDQTNPELDSVAISAGVAGTSLAGLLDTKSIEHLESMGTYRDLEPNEVLYVMGEHTDQVALVTNGALAVISPDNGLVLDVLSPGMWAGVVDYFGGAITRADLVTTEKSRVLILNRTGIEDLVSGQEEIGFKLLDLLAGAVVATLRRVNIAARDARARRENELESELAKREQNLAFARQLALRHDEYSNLSGLPHVPFVETYDADSTLAACLTAVLHAHGNKNVTETRIRAEIEDKATQFEVIDGLLRRYGLLLRPLVTNLNDLRYLEQPLIMLLGVSTYVVAQQWRQGGLEIMDPMTGQCFVDQRRLNQEFNGRAYEVRPQAAPDGPYQSLWSRVQAFFSKRGRGLVQISTAAILFQIFQFSIPLAIVLVIDFVLPFEDQTLFVVTTVGLAVVVLMALILASFRQHCLRYLRAKFELTILEQLISRVLNLPALTLEQIRPSRLLQSFRSFDQLRKQFDNRCISGLLDIVTFVLSLLLLTVLSPTLAFVVGAVTISLLVFLGLYLPQLSRLAESYRREEMQNSERLLELFESIQTIRTCGDPDNGFYRWRSGFHRVIRTECHQQKAVAFLVSILDAAWVGLIGIILCLGTMAVVQGSLSLGVLMAIVVITVAAMSGINGFSHTMIAFSLARAYVTQVNEIFELEAEATERHQSIQILRGGIELDSVDFRYLDGAPPVLTDISIKVEPGSKIAIVGPSGSGKSTLGKLLTGLYLPISGRVLIDGYDLTALNLPELRRQIGTVLQSTRLINGTIRSNISGNRPSCDLQTVMEAADIAAIHDLIETFPMKYDTVLAEGGGGLSVGQCQRINIARALVHQPKVLLLDEATSALDNQSQQRVENRLRHLDVTRIVIAHRLSTVIDADQIVVLDQGRIKEHGRHEELMARKDLYYRLVQSQAV